MKKFKSFSLGIKIACILSCVALLSVGFAAWWIIQPPETKTASGSFVVSTVETKGITVTPTIATSVTEGDNAGKIIFGKPTDSDTTATWLLPEGDMATEVLTATLKIAVEVTGNTNDTKKANINDLVNSVVITLQLPDAYETAIENNYLAAPTIGTVKCGETTLNKADALTPTASTYVISGAYDNTNGLTLTLPVSAVESATYTVDLVFDWGSLTENNNPFDFYNNGKGYDAKRDGSEDTYAEEADALLTAVAGLSSATYDITIATPVKSFS